MVGQEKFLITTQVGMVLRWTHKDKILILQKSWANIDKQKFIMG